jgi:hypothetical protein
MCSDDGPSDYLSSMTALRRRIAPRGDLEQMPRLEDSAAPTHSVRLGLGVTHLQNEVAWGFYLDCGK